MEPVSSLWQLFRRFLRQTAKVSEADQLRAQLKAALEHPEPDVYIKNAASRIEKEVKEAVVQPELPVNVEQFTQAVQTGQLGPDLIQQLETATGTTLHSPDSLDHQAAIRIINDARTHLQGFDVPLFKVGDMQVSAYQAIGGGKPTFGNPNRKDFQEDKLRIIIDPAKREVDQKPGLLAICADGNDSKALSGKEENRFKDTTSYLATVIIPNIFKNQEKPGIPSPEESVEQMKKAVKILHNEAAKAQVAAMTKAKETGKEIDAQIGNATLLISRVLPIPPSQAMPEGGFSATFALLGDPSGNIVTKNKAGKIEAIPLTAPHILAGTHKVVELPIYNDDGKIIGYAMKGLSADGVHIMEKLAEDGNKKGTICLVESDDRNIVQVLAKVRARSKGADKIVLSEQEAAELEPRLTPPGLMLSRRLGSYQYQQSIPLIREPAVIHLTLDNAKGIIRNINGPHIDPESRIIGFWGGSDVNCELNHPRHGKPPKYSDYLMAKSAQEAYEQRDPSGLAHKFVEEGEIEDLGDNVTVFFQTLQDWETSAATSTKQVTPLEKESAIARQGIEAKHALQHHFATLPARECQLIMTDTGVPVLRPENEPIGQGEALLGTLRDYRGLRSNSSLRGVLFFPPDSAEKQATIRIKMSTLTEEVPITLEPSGHTLVLNKDGSLTFNQKAP